MNNKSLLLSIIIIIVCVELTLNFTAYCIEFINQSSPVRHLSHQLFVPGQKASGHG